MQAGPVGRAAPRVAERRPRTAARATTVCSVRAAGAALCRRRVPRSAMTAGAAAAAGLYGGGGGGGGGFDAFGFDVAASGGGGGGSSLVPSGGTISTDSTGVPEVVISYTSPAAVSPASVDFGSQAIGSTSGAKSVTLTNNGGAPLAVTSASIGGTNAGDFSVSADACSGTNVAPGSSCAVQLTFAPTATGARSATLSFVDGAFDSPQTVALSGNGTTLGDVRVTIGGPATATTGSQHTFVLTVSNDGPSTALNVVMTTQVPNGTRFVGVTTTRGSCNHPASGSTTGTITCALGDLAAGGTALDSVALKITLNSKGGSIVTTASANSTASGATPATSIRTKPTTQRRSRRPRRRSKSSRRGSGRLERPDPRLPNRTTREAPCLLHESRSQRSRRSNGHP